jgi:hypothetical protein
LEEKRESGDESSISDIEMEIKSRLDQPKTSRFKGLSDYKKNMKRTEAIYKPQTWVDMSQAFKDTLKLPGIPIGAITAVGGLPDTGKSTVAVEAAAFAQKQDILPVFIITENKFSFERAEKMGVNFSDALVFNDVKTIEEGCRLIQEMLEEQEAGSLSHDLLFIWDSIGSTPSKKELESHKTEDGSRAMMETAKVIREKIGRFLSHKINNTRNKDYPYTATLLIVNQAYTAPADVPGGPPKLIFYGGGGVPYAASLVIRMGGIKSNSAKVTAVHKGVEVAYAIKSSIVVEKNHITNISVAKGKIICTDHGFIIDDKKALEEYKNRTKPEWSLNYGANWDKVSEE